MDSRTFKNNILKLKEEQFKEFVKLAAHSRGLEPPKVEFWDTTCPYGGDDEQAHIHVDLGIICVRKARLVNMSLDEIREVAIHETMHLIEANHSPDFHKEVDTTRLKTWRPPGGIYVSTGPSKISKEKESKKESPPNKEKCNYHLCRKKTVLKKCPFCGGYFCDEHHRAKPPRLPDFDDNSPLARLNREDKGGHPCPSYVEYVQKEEEKATKRWLAALDRLAGKKPKKEVVEIDLNKLYEEKEELEDKKEKKKIFKKPRIKDYEKKSVSVTEKCYQCGKELRRYTYQCKYCKHHFCGEHREVINHRCETLYAPTKKEKKKSKKGKKKPADEPVKDVDEVFKGAKKKKPKIKLFIIIVVIIVILLLAFFILVKSALPKIIIVNETKTILVNKTVVEITTKDISFEEYFNNKEKYDGRIISIIGYLQNKLEGSEKAGVYVNYLVDDFRRKITLKNLDSNQKSLFIKKGTTKEVYKVTGVFKRRYGGIELEVREINLSRKETQEVKKQITEKQNITESVQRRHPLNFSIIINKISKLFIKK